MTWSTITKQLLLLSLSLEWIWNTCVESGIISLITIPVRSTTAECFEGMDVYNLKMGIDVDCKKPRLVHTSETLTHNGHRTLNLSYQVPVIYMKWLTLTNSN